MPLDPVSQAALGAVAGRVVGRTLATMFGPEGAKTFGFELTGLEGEFDMPDDKGESLGIFTRPQLSSLEEFLATPEVRDIVESELIFSLLRVEETGDAYVRRDLASSFAELARQWNRKKKKESWETIDHPGITEKIWHAISSNLQNVTDGLIGLPDSARDFVVEYSFASSFGVQLVTGARHAPSYARGIGDILRSPDRALGLQRTVSDICNAMQNYYSELSMIHIHTDHRYTVADLYIEREVTLRDEQSDHGEVPIDVNRLFSSDLRGRTVIVGDPGVGKSTLVRHSILRMASDPDKAVAPLILICKDYAGLEKPVSIIDYLVARLSVEYSVEITRQALQDILTMGKVSLIFDGIDEVLDVTARRALIRKIEAFGREYPAISLVATSRKVGYEHARFNQDFTIASLDEFDLSQVEQYVRKWFKLTQADEIQRMAFIHESESVSDLRENPLMLSLLCALYRNRGYIPRNRRQVYKECADLLFTEWDARRQIQLPTDHRQHGNYLMQEIARFYFDTPSAQRGVDQKQLTGVISHFFGDTAGIDDRDECERRAEDFLKFCTGRAWLLSKIGSNRHGVPLFRFTHRTFEEYFTAEALVRNASTANEVADKIVEIFNRDRTTVVPEVMTQAFDDRQRRGAEEILKRLVGNDYKVKEGSHDKYLALCLRIVDVCVMSRAVTKLLPEMILNFWHRVNSVEGTEESSRALFSLHRDAQRKIVASFDQQTAQSCAIEYEILRRWLRADVTQHRASAEPGWSDELDPRLTRLMSTLELSYKDSSGATRSYLAEVSTDATLVDRGILLDLIEPGRPLPSGDYAVPLLAVNHFGSAKPGSVLQFAFTPWSAAPSRVTPMNPEHADRVLRNFWRRRTVPTATPLESRMITQAFESKRRLRSYRFMRNRFRRHPELLLWLAVVYAESSSLPHAARESTWRSHNPLFTEIVDQTVGRDNFTAALRNRRAEDPDTAGPVHDCFGKYGQWAKRWVNGGSLVSR